MATTPLDTLEAVLNTARTRLLDAIASLGGDIFTDVNPFTPTVTNAAWRRWQELLVKYGYSGLKGQILYSNLPASTQSDSSVPCYFTYNGFFDGTTLQTAFPLPQDMIAPDTKPGALSERINGDVIMTDLGGPELEGLPVVPLAPWNRIWEWRQDVLVIPGTTNNFDFRIRYFAYYADFVFGAITTLNGNISSGVSTVNVISGANIANGQVIQIDLEQMTVASGGGTTVLVVARGVNGTVAAAHTSGATVNLTGYAIAVPIIRSLNGFAWLVAAEMAKSRSDLDASDFEAKADMAAQVVLGRDGTAPQPEAQ